LAEFANVVEAVRCAIELQRQMALRNDDVPSERRIQFRIGINVGDIIIEADDIYGDCANYAARLEAMAAPGGICISAIVHDQVQGRLECALADLGEQSSRKITRPTRVYRVEPQTAPQERAGIVGTALALPDKPSIAVLPLLNISGATSSRGRSEKAAGGCASPRTDQSGSPARICGPSVSSGTWTTCSPYKPRSQTGSPTRSVSNWSIGNHRQLSQANACTSNFGPVTSNQYLQFIVALCTL
jgi:hypothetical protein